MPNQYVLYPMVLSGIYIGTIGLREDQIDYFNIPDPTASEAELMNYIGSIKAHKRNIHTNRLDDTAPTRVKTIDRVAAVARSRSKTIASRGGKPIRIPTELTSTPAQSSTAPGAPPRTPSIRFTTIKFPGAANNAEISSWLFLKCASHKPKYFKTPAGAIHSVSGAPIPTPAPAP